jgi:hypothetical protein
MPKKIILLLCVGVIIALSGCAAQVRTSPSINRERVEFTRDFEALDFSTVQYTPWDVAAAVKTAEVRDPKAYTIMIYLNGSDLETDGGEATLDILEMLSSGVDTELFNIIIFTGGTYRWRTQAIPADDCVIWRLKRDGLERIVSTGLRNMGDAGTLSGFISFTRQAFPAERFGLIFWDHGGGSIAGFGHDEIFNDSYLTLLEMDYAFEQAGLARDNLEFIGFDACLMATVEMAVVSSRYARYFIASQDLEPGEGWDYNFLGVLNDNPEMDGAMLGRTIADSYMDFYGSGTIENLTMSVTDLTHVKSVMAAMGELMDRCTESLILDWERAFPVFSRRRHRTKTFGAGTRRDNDCDMVDTFDMAGRLRDIFPEEAAMVQAALENAVVYNRHNLLTDVGGLSSYYIFGGKRYAEDTLNTYSALNMSPEYTEYLKKFAGIITAGRGEHDLNDPLDTRLILLREADGELLLISQTDEGDTKEDRLWPAVGGMHICLHKLGESANSAEYAVPITLNGKDADLIIKFNTAYPAGKIIGTRKEEGYIIQKGVDALRNGDEIAFYYRIMDFNERSGWVLSESIVVDGELKLEWIQPDGECFTQFLATDIWLEEYFL